MYSMEWSFGVEYWSRVLEWSQILEWQKYLLFAHKIMYSIRVKSFHSTFATPKSDSTPLQYSAPTFPSKTPLHRIDGARFLPANPTHPPVRLPVCLSTYMWTCLWVHGFLTACPPTCLSGFQPCPDLTWPATNLCSSLVKYDLFRLVILHMLSLEQAFCESLYLYSEWMVNIFFQQHE